MGSATLSQAAKSQATELAFLALLETPTPCRPKRRKEVVTPEEPPAQRRHIAVRSKAPVSVSPVGRDGLGIDGRINFASQTCLASSQMSIKPEFDIGEEQVRATRKRLADSFKENPEWVSEPRLSSDSLQHRLSVSVAMRNGGPILPFSPSRIFVATTIAKFGKN